MVSVLTARYSGEDDPVHALDDAIASAIGDAAYEVMICEPHDPSVRVLLLAQQVPEDPEDLDAPKNNAISMELRTPLTTIRSSDLMVSDTELRKIIELSKNFHHDGVPFEVWTEQGYVVVPPEVAKVSILTINISTEKE